MVQKIVMRLAGPEDRKELKGKFWKCDGERRRLGNDVFGVSYQVIDAVSAETGEVLYEKVSLQGPRTEMHVVVRNDDSHFGFVYHGRFDVIKPEYSVAQYAEHPERAISVLEAAWNGGTGIEEYQVAHGLAKNRLEEVLEEIGLQWIEAAPIGFVHAIPPLGGSAHQLFAVKVGREASGKKPEKHEEIGHVRFFPPEEVRKVLSNTICGMTKGALWTFRSWGLEQPGGSFWHRAAMRL